MPHTWKESFLARKDVTLHMTQHSSQQSPRKICGLSRQLLALVVLYCSLPIVQPQKRDILTGISSTIDYLPQNQQVPSSASSQYTTQYPDVWSRGKSQRLTNFESSNHRRQLQQFGLVPAPAPAPVSFIQHGLQGQPSNTTVYTIINNNDAVFGMYSCIDACAHANTCISGNAWLWICNGTNPSHHYWVWEPDSGIIRSAAGGPDDTWNQNPEICLDMCTDARWGQGACAVTAKTNTLNVGYDQCTGFPNQQWTLQGTQIVNKFNNYCLSAGAQPCGRWADCNKSLVQTKQEDQILNVFAEPCSSSNPAQRWSLGPAPNSLLLNYTSLSTSAAKYAPPNVTLAALGYNNSRQVIHFVDEDSGACLSIENQASCQSSQPNGSTVISNANSTVCVWQNAYLTTCWQGGSDPSTDQGWTYDNSTKQVVLAANVSQNVCLEICTDNSYARGSCSLLPSGNNIGIQSCNGAPTQQWEFNDGQLYNAFMDMCIVEEPFCMVDYQLFNKNSTASTETVDGFPLASCQNNVRNSPWSMLPWNFTNGGHLGIRNLVGGACDTSNNTVGFVIRTAGLVENNDPIAPGSPASTGVQSKSNSGAIIGGSVGGGIGGLFLIFTFVSFIVMRNRKHTAALKAQEEEFHKKAEMYEKSGQLWSIDSDTYVKPKGGWLTKLDLTDDISPEDIEICKTAEGEDWKLGEGAFGTVYKANRFGVQPVAVKVLREESSQQVENFQREIDLLRGLRDNNIVLFLGVCKKDNSLMLVTEYMPQGDLWHALSHSSNRLKFSWYQRGRKIALDVARGLVHLHSRDIVHMDLKSPNILLGRDLAAKIADVGLARSVTNSSITQMTSIGTMAWAAPELKRNFKIGRKEGPRNVTPKADVFSFGVVVWEIVTGEDPCFSSRAVAVPHECPPAIEELIDDCLSEDPEERPDMRVVFERLKGAASIPPPGASEPLPTPLPTPPISRDGSVRSQQAPQSNMQVPRSAPKSGLKSGNKTSDYTSRLGLAAALRKTFRKEHMSGDPPKSLLRQSNFAAESIPENQQEEVPFSEENPFKAAAMAER